MADRYPKRGRLPGRGRPTRQEQNRMLFSRIRGLPSRTGYAERPHPYGEWQQLNSNHYFQQDRSENLRNVSNEDRRSTDFFLTLHNYEHNRETIENVISTMASKYIISRENNEHFNDEIPFHFHVYLHTTTELSMQTLRTRVTNSLFKNIPVSRISINIQLLSSEKAISNTLKYATKGDRFALVKNISLRKLDMYFRVHHWIRTHHHFDTADPFYFEFVCKTKHLRKELLIMHTTYWNKVRLWDLVNKLQKRQDVFFKEYDIQPSNWLHQVFSWCTQVQVALAENNEIENPQQRCLMIHGLPGTGKSYAVEMLLPKLTTFAYYPSPATSEFMFSGINSSHKCIYFADVSKDLWANQIVREMFLRLTEGNLLSVSVKHVDPMTVYFTGVIIMVSNYHPPDGDDMVSLAFRRRFKVIHANCKWSECVGTKDSMNSNDDHDIFNCLSPLSNAVGSSNVNDNPNATFSPEIRGSQSVYPNITNCSPLSLQSIGDVSNESNVQNSDEQSAGIVSSDESLLQIYHKKTRRIPSATDTELSECIEEFSSPPRFISPNSNSENYIPKEFFQTQFEPK